MKRYKNPFLIRTFAVLFLIIGMPGEMNHPTWGGPKAHASSEWVAGLGYQARLIKGSASEDGTLMAALEIALEDGWKTYWRVPGENGIPPVFDFASSSNVGSIDILWPRPTIFRDSNGLSIGYKERLILPFTIKPEQADAAVDLKLYAFFGVCAEICVPVDASLSLTFNKSDGVNNEQRLIDTALSLVPKSGSTGDFDISKAAFTKGSSAEYVTLDMKLPAGTKDLTILTEGPENWYFDPYRALIEGSATGVESTTIKIPVYRYVLSDLTGEESIRLTVILDDKAFDKKLLLN